jgi:predicted dehydrogenase
MSSAAKMGIIGCGDFLRWQAGDISRSSSVSVHSLFDTRAEQAKMYADKLGGTVRNSAEDIINDPAIDTVCLFVPPWVRKGLLTSAMKAGKHVLTTKPLGPTVAECAAMVRAVSPKLRCGVLYRRSGNAVIETYKKIFESGEVGRLALYKQDWIHHYPQWNTWALDPKKNGGPFMDAMIHNQNIARYLMGRKATRVTYFSDHHAHELPCADTEFMKLDFEGGGAAHLFITWAADLAVYSTSGNDREHIDVCYMITDKGWRLTEGERDGKHAIIASREGKEKVFPIVSLGGSVYDRFIESARSKSPLPADIPSVREAYEDIKLVRDAEKSRGKMAKVSFALTPKNGKVGK